MTTVIGLKDKDGIWIGADSQTTVGEMKREVADKVFTCSGFTIGVAGDVRSAQVIRPEFGMKFPKTIWELPDAIRLKHRCHGLDYSEDGNDKSDAHFIVAFKGGLYEILTGYSIREIHDYTSIGSGMFFALGTLKCLEKQKIKLAPRKRVELALEVSSEIDTGSSAPFNIIKAK